MPCNNKCYITEEEVVKIKSSEIVVFEVGRGTAFLNLEILEVMWRKNYVMKANFYFNLLVDFLKTKYVLITFLKYP